MVEKFKEGNIEKSRFLSLALKSAFFGFTTSLKITAKKSKTLQNSKTSVGNKKRHDLVNCLFYIYLQDLSKKTPYYRKQQKKVVIVAHCLFLHYIQKTHA